MREFKHHGFIWFHYSQYEYEWAIHEQSRPTKEQINEVIDIAGEETFIVAWGEEFYERSVVGLSREGFLPNCFCCNTEKEFKLFNQDLGKLKQYLLAAKANENA